MAKNPNQGGSTNRQGPGVGRQGKRGPITGNLASGGGGPARPWSLTKGTKSKAGSNMSGHAWKQSPPASHRSGDGGWYLGRRKK